MFKKLFSAPLLRSLHIHIHPSQNVYSILLLNGLVMVTNEGLIACKYLRQGNIGRYLEKCRIFPTYANYFKYI